MSEGISPDDPKAPSGQGSGGSGMGRLAQRGVLSLGGAGVSAIANLGLIVLVTRAFSQETAGHLFSATSLFVVLQALCALGTATGSVYFIARLRAKGRDSEVRRVLRLGLWPVGIVSVCVAGACFIFAEPLGGILGDGAQPVLYVRLLALFLPLAVFSDVLIACTQGFHTMTPTVVYEKIGRPLAQFALVGFGAVTGAASALPVLWMAPYLVVVVLTGRYLSRRLRQMAAGKEPDSENPKQGSEDHEPFSPGVYWRFTAPRGMAAAAQLALQRLDIVLVAALLGAVPAAIYTAATRFLVLGQVGSQAVALAVQPTFSALLANDDFESTRRVYRTSTAWVMAVTWPIHLTVAVTAPWLMQLFGPGYGSGTTSVIILAMAMLVATGCGTVTMLLLMGGRSMLNLINVFVSLAVNIALNLLLIPSVGITGAAIAWGVSIMLANLLPLAQVHRIMGLNPFGRGSLLVAGLALACYALVPAAGWLGGQWWVLGIVLFISTPIYGLGLYWLRGVLELDQLVSTVRRKVSRSPSTSTGGPPG